MSKDKAFFIVAVFLGGFFASFFLFENYLLPDSGLEKKLNFSSSGCPEESEAMVTGVIDGDTILVEGGFHIRLIGIDAPEKNEPCYSEAKRYLEELIERRVVRLEKDTSETDKYGRCLRYIFAGGDNVNLLIVKEGLAAARFYEPDIRFQEEIKMAEKEAISEKKGCLWQEEIAL